MWPIDVREMAVLDAPLHCATARQLYYQAPIHTLQDIRFICLPGASATQCPSSTSRGQFSPRAKLQTLVRTFDQVNEVGL